jgi:DNA-binding LacI/PurR family transcriptional regulator
MAKGKTKAGSGCRVACVMDLSATVVKHGFSHQRMLGALQEGCAGRGWTLLTVDNTNQPEQAVFDQIELSHAQSVILDCDSGTLIRLLKERGLPAVVLDSWVWDSWVDSVVQDGQMAGLQAVEYLVSRGCKRLAWFGFLRRTDHAIDRLSGVVAGLNVQGLELPPDLRVHAEEKGVKQAALDLLSRQDRPQGVIALWQEYALALKKAADELGLAVGRDFDMVGWATEESFYSVYCPAFKGDTPPAVTWSVQTMAETALARLSERQQRPKLPAVRIKIPTRLTFAE